MSIQAVLTDKAPKPIGPYSQAVRAGNLLFISGQLPIDPATGDMPRDPAAQARQALSNLKAIVEQAGGSLAQVVRVGIFMTDLAAFKAVNEVYAGFFTQPFPARTTVQVSKLPLGAGLEIEAVAAL